MKQMQSGVFWIWLETRSMVTCRAVSSEIFLHFRTSYDIFPCIDPQKIFLGETGMIPRNDSLRYLCYFLLVLSLFFIFGPLNAGEVQLIRVRRGDSISYLSFKLYGMYDAKIEALLRRENPRVKDLNVIHVGQQLRFPAPETVRKMLLGELAEPAEPAKAMEPKEARPLKEAPPGEETVSAAQVRAHKGVITFLEGEAQVKKAGETEWSSARPNMILSENDQIRVLAKSRAELILDNQTVMRLSENTRLTVQKLEEEAASQKETARMQLSLGKLWTRTARLFNPSSRYDVTTPTAIAGVTGTVYLVRVADDKTTSIQVFQGAVNVYNPFPPAKPSLPGQRTPLGQPQEVTGPGEVPGPTAISREEWTKIILRQFQQITVTDRDISRPVSFDMQRERQDEWVRWNEERDSDFQPPARPR
jgi:phage tail protein X